MLPGAADLLEEWGVLQLMSSGCVMRKRPDATVATALDLKWLEIELEGIRDWHLDFVGQEEDGGLEFCHVYTSELRRVHAPQTCQCGDCRR